LLKRIDVVALITSGITVMSLVVAPSLASASRLTSVGYGSCTIGGSDGGSGGPVDGFGSGGGL